MLVHHIYQKCSETYIICNCSPFMRTQQCNWFDQIFMLIIWYVFCEMSHCTRHLSAKHCLPNNIVTYFVMIMTIALKCPHWNRSRFRQLITMRTGPGCCFVAITGKVLSFSCLNTLRPRHMAAILQTTFSNAFSWMKMYELWQSLFLGVQFTTFQHWFWLWLGADQATSHYLNQWWSCLLTHICVTRPQWVNISIQ